MTLILHQGSLHHLAFLITLVLNFRVWVMRDAWQHFDVRNLAESVFVELFLNLLEDLYYLACSVISITFF
jgi:hypothetical protein